MILSMILSFTINSQRKTTDGTGSKRECQRWRRRRLEVLESTAEAVINAGSIGKVSVMPDAVIEELRNEFNLS